MYTSILENQISELENQLSQKDILIAFLSEEIMKKSQDKLVVIDENSNISNRESKGNKNPVIRNPPNNGNSINIGRLLRRNVK